MVRTCMFCGAEKLGEDLTYHSFPLMAAEWLYNMGLGSNFMPPKNAMLCSNHFEKKFFQEGTGKGCLLPGSIPTIFGQYKSGCVFCHARKGQDKNRSFRKFPLNPELLQKWIAAMAVKDFVPNKKSVLCSDHFEKDCFRKTGRNACTLTMKNNAVPTIFKLPLIDKTPAGEHNRNYQLCESHMETDPSLSPEISAAYEGREKRRLSLDLPPPKMSKTDTTNSMVNSMRASTNDSDKKQCQVDKVPSTSSASEAANTHMQRNGQTPTTSRRIRHIVHDHRYQTTPRSMVKKMLLQKKRIQALMLEKHAQKQHISRLKQQVTSLKQIVSALRKTPSLPDSELECLESIADTDVSQFLKRFIKNQSNIKEKQVLNETQCKSQNTKKLSGISSAKYPAALRAFAMTLHFYSPRAYGFVRRKFCKALPDPSTIRSWYSAVDGEPGFTLESFQALKFKAAEAKKYQKKVLVLYLSYNFISYYTCTFIAFNKNVFIFILNVFLSLT